MSLWDSSYRSREASPSRGRYDRRREASPSRDYQPRRDASPSRGRYAGFLSASSLCAETITAVMRLRRVITSPAVMRLRRVDGMLAFYQRPHCVQKRLPP